MRAFFTVKLMLSINNFFYIIPIRKDNKKMSLSRKHFRELAVILGKNRATENIVFDVVNFCFKHNRHFNKETFLDAIKKSYEEINSDPIKRKELSRFL
jgi:hypothetical protein